METLKRLLAVSSLVFVLGVTCLADGPTCTQDPGQTSTPPCALAQITPDPTDTSGTQTSSTTNSVDIVAIGEVAIGTFLTLL